jgi:repressor LexA
LSKISLRQQRMLDFIQNFIETHGYPPAVRDIQHGCDISSTSVVDYNLRILQQRGILNRAPDVARGIRLVSKPLMTDGIPVLGYISAGSPLPIPNEEIWTQSEALEIIDVPNHLRNQFKDLYALRVKGVSMIDALIDDGDVVVVCPPSDVRDGDMVVVWLKLEKEATLKRIYREGRRVRLQPANSQMNSILTNADNVEVQGKVTAVLRFL